MKVAIITPYHDEPEDWVLAMAASVARQTHPATHILVGDGVRRPAFEGEGRIHMSLPDHIGDSGGTPRAAAGAWAVQNGFEMVAYVDADDRIEPAFVEGLVKARAKVGGEVFSYPHAYHDTAMRPARNMFGQHIGAWAHGSARRIGGRFFAFMPASGMALAGRALAHVGEWSRIPRDLRRVHDVIFSQSLISKPLTLVWMAQARYHYRLTHGDQYARFDLLVPPGLQEEAKSEGKESAIRILSALDDAGRRKFETMFGIDVGKLPDRDGVRDAVSKAHVRRGIFVRRAEGKYEIVAPL